LTIKLTQSTQHSAISIQPNLCRFKLIANCQLSIALELTYDLNSAHRSLWSLCARPALDDLPVALPGGHTSRDF